MKSLLYILIGVTMLLTARDIPTMRYLEDRAARGDASAVALLRDSAGSGSARAANFLGFLYWQGRGVRQDRDSGLYFLDRAAALGDVKALANLGHLLICGDGVDPDTLKALRYLNRAARAGAPAALRELSDLLAGAVPGKGILAERYKEVNAGSLAVVAFNIMKGIRLPYDYRRAMDYFLMSARMGDPSAQFIIGEHLELFPDALELKPEEETAEYWYAKARKKGVADAVTARRCLDVRTHHLR